MKTISTQLSYFLKDKEIRQNLRLLFKYVALLVFVVVVFSVLFHVIMLEVEGIEHSWMTGVYWTLTVMSTLGFGDITFQSDIGRFFSVVVLMSGIVMLLIVLPFAFIRFFYAPWLEAQIRSRAPRDLPPGTEGHVIITSLDTIARGLIERLRRDDIFYTIVEPDTSIASEWHADGLSVVVGEIDAKQTYENVRAERARLIMANRSDIVNTNIALTVRSLASITPIAAISTAEDAVDVLELSGVTHVLPLKRWLGEQLANRIDAQRAALHPIGEYGDLKIGELPVFHTPLAGKTIRETRLRETTGVSIVGIWEQGRLLPARPETRLNPSSVAVVMGSEEALEEVDTLLLIYNLNPNPVLLIGGGRVGVAAAHALAKKDVPIHLVERDHAKCERLRPVCTQVFQGDASDYEVLQESGINEAPSVLLTTNDDAMNIYLSSYCRRLNADLRIVSRITHERNLDAIYRAGADFVLSYATLGIEAIMSILHDRELMVLGEGVDLFTHAVPGTLQGKTLAQSEIGARTGLTVVALKTSEKLVTRLSPDTTLEPGTHLVLIGSEEQIDTFEKIYK